jgi:hypothetical protein
MKPSPQLIEGVAGEPAPNLVRQRFNVPRDYALMPANAGRSHERLDRCRDQPSSAALPHPDLQPARRVTQPRPESQIVAATSVQPRPCY